MFWIVRWTNAQGNDQSVVIEAKSRVVAETIALKRDIPVVFIGEADAAEVEAAREAKLLWRSTPHVTVQTCFGQPVHGRQIACLLLCGVWTIGILLQVGGILPPFIGLPM